MCDSLILLEVGSVSLPVQYTVAGSGQHDRSDLAVNQHSSFPLISQLLVLQPQQNEHG